MDDQIKYYVEQMRKGKIDAFFPLMELEDGAVPLLIDTYYRERDLEIRTTLIEAIWQHREVDTLDFLADVLQDDTFEIWEEALDGIVATGRERGLKVLAVEKARLLAFQKLPKKRVEWVEEAIDQLTDFLTNQDVDTD